MRLFSNLFSSKPPSNFTMNKTFCEHKGFLRGFGTMRLTGDLHLNFFRKFEKKLFLIFFLFFERFSVEKDGFFAVSSWGKLVFESNAYPFGYFRPCKIDEVLTKMSFYPWFSVRYCLFGFQSESSLEVFAKHGFASMLYKVPLCYCFRACNNLNKTSRCCKILLGFMEDSCKKCMIT